jgi:hypothetical protein
MNSPEKRDHEVALCAKQAPVRYSFWFGNGHFEQGLDHVDRCVYNSEVIKGWIAMHGQWEKQEFTCSSRK